MVALKNEMNLLHLEPFKIHLVMSSNSKELIHLYIYPLSMVLPRWIYNIIIL